MIKDWSRCDWSITSGWLWSNVGFILSAWWRAVKLVNCIRSIQYECRSFLQNPFRAWNCSRAPFERPKFICFWQFRFNLLSWLFFPSWNPCSGMAFQQTANGSARKKGDSENLCKTLGDTIILKEELGLAGFLVYPVWSLWLGRRIQQTPSALWCRDVFPCFLRGKGDDGHVQTCGTFW